MATMHALFVPLAALAFASPAFAEDHVTQGIGFAQRGEGTWLCRHEDPAEALGCAREHCKEEAPSEDCAPVAWCYPAGWSGEMTVQLPGAEKTAVLCGMASLEVLKAMLAALCASNKDAAGCDMTLSVDPDGNERKVTGVRFAGGNSPAASEGSAPSPEGKTDAGGAPAEGQ
jgi:hypothetical protein